MLVQPPRAGTDHCLILLDIDHFKNVNDTHGHVMGDRVIEGLGEILRSTASTPTQAVARYGGEEFAVLLPHSSLEHSTRLAESLRQRAKAMKIYNRTTPGDVERDGFVRCHVDARRRRCSHPDRACRRGAVPVEARRS